MSNARRTESSRRAFLKTTALCAAAGAATLWLPRRARSAPPEGPVRRVIVIYAGGGLRWTATFDGQADLAHNPWGVQWVGSGAAPGWGFSRMLQQKPVYMADSQGWSGIYDYLSSNGNFNTTNPILASNTEWNGAKLPTFAEIAGNTAVLRCSMPGYDSSHSASQRTLMTGSRSGQNGLVTAMQHALKNQMGASFDSFYPLPAVCVGGGQWSYGVGEFAASRPIVLSGAYGVPTVNPTLNTPVWARNTEVELDQALQASRQEYMGQAVANFINDKASGDAHVGQLVDPALHLVGPTSTPTAAMGTLMDGTTPVTNSMLLEVFGARSDLAPAGDILFDAYASMQSSATPAWADEPFGLSGALAVRLLQTGAPIVTLSTGNFDTHSYEVIDPKGESPAGRPMPPQIIQLTRLLAGLHFALSTIADDKDPGHSLWDSTVIFVCSEFGRGVGNNSPDGFNQPNGLNLGGSDHDPWSAWPILGGPVVAGGQLLTDADGGFYDQNRLFTTLLRGMGVDDGHSTYLPYADTPPIPGLLKGVA